ncbi:3-hydroxyacyl-CoA dehydrogenase [Aromatoleum petrolei]|uniref:3-hydroxyacyl-CoA dehydrogenase n=1 Tax=Aromatoleum petrolei TaxID=76116 RepID=A0ABX1MWH1_9RHOO|nr:3-hydroxyacyl-CoA dehydrogenase [Aromatoleum petrolei]NMF90671.1 3-hydroxyacyl-CoA dehydrogenase [Aromatoleum petrolei]QTQ38777.1 3-hydroxyadipyl-CoA dehydrogenase [Aromatoleum petrolei]
MFDAMRNDLTLGVVGTGLMGRGIAQIAVQAGVTVRLFDTRAGAAAEACDAVGGMLAKLAEKGKIDTAAARAATERMTVAASLAELAGCDVVVEAIVENLDAKRGLFRDLEEVVSDECVLATNTSSLSVTSIAAACRRPERVAGLHFFSPVPLMKVVEIIDGVRGDRTVGDALMALARRMGHTPVRASDTPGFIVNHAGRGYLTESLRVLGEGITDFATLDRILKESVGFRMGPCELLDLTGLDVSHPVMESIYEQYYQEPRFRPSPITRQRLAGGLLGRKSGQGFYVYKDGSAQSVAMPPVPAVAPVPLWVSRADAALHARVVAVLEAQGVALDRGDRPSADSVGVVLPVGTDATTCALAEGLDPKRTLALDPLFVDKHLTLMTTPVTAAEARDAAWAALAAGGKAVSVVRDSAGLVAQRVVATIVNIGCDIAQQRVASPEDIDSAVRLGLGYPKGPLALGDSLGAATILAILDGMHEFYRDPRYRPSPWLTRRARLGVSLTTPDN